MAKRFLTPIISPTFTGTPTAPTATEATNTTQIATTAFVTTAVSSVGAGATVSDTAPGSPTGGNLWYNSSDGKTYVYYEDGASDQWVEIGASTLSTTGNYDGGMSNSIYGGVAGLDAGGAT